MEKKMSQNFEIKKREKKLSTFTVRKKEKSYLDKTEVADYISES